MKITKKLLVSLLALAMIACSIAPAAVFAAEDFSLEVAQVEAVPGQEIDVDISFNNQKDGIAGYQFGIIFNSTLLQYVGCVSNSEFPSSDDEISISIMNDVDAENGQLIFGGCTTKDFIYSNPIVTLKFKVLNVDTSTEALIGLSDIDITNVEGTSIPCAPVRGQVDITVKHIESIELADESAVLNVDDTKLLNYTILPEDYTDTAEVKWSIDNTEVATVENGLVTALRAGQAVVTVSVGEFTDTCTIYVVDFSVNVSELNLKVGESDTLEITLNPADAPVEITCESSDPSVATAEKTDKGIVVTAIAEGEATIKVTVNGKTVECSTAVAPAYMKGDFDNDKEITVADALAALRIAAKLVPEDDTSIAIGDIDNDQHVTVADALAILRVAAKLTNTL